MRRLACPDLLATCSRVVYGVSYRDSYIGVGALPFPPHPQPSVPLHVFQGLQMVGSSRLMARTDRSIQVSTGLYRSLQISEDKKIKKIIQKFVGQGSPDFYIGAPRLPSSYGVPAPPVDRGAGRRKPLFKGISLSPQLEGGYSCENHRYTVVSGWKDQQHKNSTFPTFHRSISCSGSASATSSRVVYGVAPAPPVSMPFTITPSLQHSTLPTPSLPVPSTLNPEPFAPSLHYSITPLPRAVTRHGNPFSAGTALPPRLVGENN